MFLLNIMRYHQKLGNHILRRYMIAENGFSSARQASALFAVLICSLHSLSWNHQKQLKFMHFQYDVISYWTKNLIKTIENQWFPPSRKLNSGNLFYRNPYKTNRKSILPVLLRFTCDVISYWTENLIKTIGNQWIPPSRKDSGVSICMNNPHQVQKVTRR